MAGDVGFYTVAEAARILRLSSQRVRQLLASGALRGVRDEVGHWEVDPRSIRETLDERREVLFGTLEDPQRLSELEAEVRELRYFLGRAEGRLELLQNAESALLENLEHERERADTERKRVETLQLETERLREQLAEARAVESAPAKDTRSWWRRFFGLQ
jgi:excisionase family DNA binding protein